MEDSKVVKKNPYKYCIVPCCTSTTVKKPGKLFFSVPKNELTRKRWCRAMHRDEKKNKKLSPNSPLYCCEDHFSLENDMENYWQYRLSDSYKIYKLKAGVLPSIFECQKRNSPIAMQDKCSVPACRGNYDVSNKVAVFGFPTDERLRDKWLKAIPKKDFKIGRNSKVCERHFKEDEVLRNVTYFNKKTGQMITAPIKWLRLRKNAVPSIFPGCQSFMSSSSLQESQSQKQQTLKTDLGTEFQNVAETSIAIKQELEESVDEPLQLVIGQVFSAKELLSSSNSSSSAHNIQTVPENVLPIANPDSTNLDQTPATHVSNKTAQKRKINDAEPDANDITPAGSQSELCRRAKPSMSSKRNSNLHQHAGISKKSTVCSTLPTKNGENATREIFQSLFDGSGSNPLFSSRTTERPGDLFNVFADFIADKLREMDWDDCAYTLRTILDAVFEAGKVQHDNEDKSDISSPKNSSGSLYKE